MRFRNGLWAVIAGFGLVFGAAGCEDEGEEIGEELEERGEEIEEEGEDAFEGGVIGAVPDAAAATEAEGRVVAVDPDERRILLDPADQSTPLTLRVTEESEILLPEEPGTFDDLREGQEVRATYEERDGVKVLERLQVVE